MSMRVDAKLNLKGFDALRKGLAPGQYVKVGVFQAHQDTRPGDTISNTELAAVQEFGSYSGKIPPRSFIRMPIQERRKEILAFASSKKVADLLMAGEQKKALGLMGACGENQIQKAFDTGGFGKWAPNAPSTIARKGSAAPLIDTDELRKSVTSVVVAP